MRTRYSIDLRGSSTHHTLLTLVPFGARVLDLGCASGYLGEALARQQCVVWGVDKDADALASVPSGAYTALAAVDLDAPVPWPFGTQQFDVILAADVLEHLAHPDRLLRWLPDLLAPQGIVLVSLPNVAHFTVRFRLLAGHFDYTDSGILDRTHLHLYTFASARRLVEASGFRVTQVLGGSVWVGALINRGIWPMPRLRGLFASGIVVVATSQRASV